jgi:tetratricopeptide (TPR) repeat protein
MSGNGLPQPFGSPGKDMFVSPDIVRQVLENIRCLAGGQGRGAQISETDVRNIITQQLSQMNPSSLSSFQDHFRVSHQVGSTDDLEGLSKAVVEARAVLAAAPPADPIRSAHHNSLGLLLRWVSDKTHSLRDIDEAVDHGREAVAQLADDSLTKALYQSHLARSLCSRFALSGEAAYLNEAVAKGREATSGLTLVYPYKATRWNNMAHILAAKLSTPQGTVADIDEAVGCATNAIDDLPANDSRRGTFLHDLASLLVKKYERTGALANLNQAIRYGQEAAGLKSEKHSAILKHLGIMYGMRSVRTRARDDITRAIQYARDAADATASDDELVNKGQTSRQRYL